MQRRMLAVSKRNTSQRNLIEPSTPPRCIICAVCRGCMSPAFSWALFSHYTDWLVCPRLVFPVAILVSGWKGERYLTPIISHSDSIPSLTRLLLLNSRAMRGAICHGRQSFYVPVPIPFLIRPTLSFFPLSILAPYCNQKLWHGLPWKANCFALLLLLQTFDCLLA